MKRMIFVQQKIAKEQFKVFCRFMNAIFQIIIVCSDQRIPKIPCVLRKNVIRYIKTQCAQILDEKHRRRPGVSFPEYMNLPQSGYEYWKVMNHFIHW